MLSRPAAERKTDTGINRPVQKLSSNVVFWTENYQNKTSISGSCSLLNYSCEERVIAIALVEPTDLLVRKQTSNVRPAVEMEESFGLERALMGSCLFTGQDTAFSPVISSRFTISFQRWWRAVRGQFWPIPTALIHPSGPTGLSEQWTAGSAWLLQPCCRDAASAQSWVLWGGGKGLGHCVTSVLMWRPQPDRCPAMITQKWKVKHCRGMKYLF